MKASRNWSGPRAERYSEALDMLALLDARERWLNYFPGTLPLQDRRDTQADITEARAYWGRIALRNAPRKPSRVDASTRWTGKAGGK